MSGRLVAVFTFAWISFWSAPGWAADPPVWRVDAAAPGNAPSTIESFALDSSGTIWLSALRYEMGLCRLPAITRAESCSHTEQLW